MLNKWTGIGRLTKDPELKQTANQKSVVKVTLAINRIKREGQQQTADFIPVTVYGISAENLCKYQKKGSLLSVTGRLQINTWKDQEDKYHSATEVVASEIYYLEKANNNNNGSAGNNTEYDDFHPVDEEDDLPF